MAVVCLTGSPSLSGARPENQQMILDIFCNFKALKIYITEII